MIDKSTIPQDKKAVKEPQTHVFRKPCGCVACLIVNEPHMFDELAKQQRYAAERDETYELMETETVRHMSWYCETHKKKAVAK